MTSAPMGVTDRTDLALPSSEFLEWHRTLGGLGRIEPLRLGMLREEVRKLR